MEAGSSRLPPFFLPLRVVVPTSACSSPDLKPVPIAFCITDLDAGGAERALVQIVTRLDRRRWSPQVFCLSNEGVLTEDFRDAGIPVTCFGANRSWNFPCVILRLKRELKRLKPAVLQTFLYHANIIGRVAGRLAKVPHIVSGIRVAERRSRFRLWLDRITQCWVDRHICVSRGVADFSIQIGKLDANKVVVIPNGVDFDRFANAKSADLTEFAIPPDHKTILCVGRLDPQKGTMVLLEAFSQFAPDHPDVHLLFIGSGPLEAKAKEYISSHGLEKQVHLAGQRDDVPQFMQACNCLVLASLWEGMPNVILEAMAAGLPIVSTEVEGIFELLKSGENALLVPVGHSGALATALHRLFADSDLRRALTSSTQAIAQKGFTWQKIAKNYEEIYEELCRRTADPASIPPT